MNKVSASTILSLLQKKHSKDICIPECKTGSTWLTKNNRMDAWVMKKSWAHPKTIAYEIKVSRADYVNDYKWINYLPYCNEFYFVAPLGIIEPDELPPEAGLLVCSKNIKKLYVKKAALSRDVKIPEEIYKYILMSRVKIVSSTYWNDRN